MNKHNVNLLKEMAVKEAVGINKGFNQHIETGMIITKNTLELWTKTFTEQKELKEDKDKVEALEIFTKYLLLSIEDKYQIDAKAILSIPSVSATELFKSYGSALILMKKLQKKNFTEPPRWTKQFNASMLG